MHRNRNPRNSSMALVILATMIGGTNPAMMEVALRSMDPLLFASLRFLFIGIVLLLFVRDFRFLRIPKIRRRLLLSSLILLIFLPLFAFGIELSGALKASILGLTIPVFVYLFSVLFLREPMVGRVMAGGCLALLGSLLLIGLPVVLGQSFAPGDLLLLGAYASVAASIVHTKYLYTWLTPNEVLSVRFSLVGAVVLGYVLLAGDLATLATGNSTAWSLLLYGVLVSGVLANTLYHRGLQHVRAEDTAPVYYLEPLVGTIIATGLLGERIELSGLIGVIIIIGGVMVAHPYQINRYHRYNTAHPPHYFRFIRQIMRLANRQLRS